MIAPIWHARQQWSATYEGIFQSMVSFTLLCITCECDEYHGLRHGSPNVHGLM